MKLRKTIQLAFVASLIASTAPLARATDQGAPYASAGVDYSSGKYGLDTTTTIWDVPLKMGYSGSNWSFGVTLPYLHVSGPGNVIQGVGVVRNTNPQGRGGRGNALIGTPATYLSGTASGMGDAVAEATFHAVENKHAGFAMDITGRIKFGTASADKGLGTGQNDYGAAIDLYKTLGPAWMAFGGVAYTQLGSSTYIQLNNVWSANTGVSYTLGQGNSVGLQLFYQQRPADTGYVRREATLYLSHKINDAWSLHGYLLGGFSDGSPDYGIGMSARASF
ncbi:MAG: transporter [Proteobacteria bacterium]|nr:transporter [Pseudomonadota bacterium]